MNKIAEHIEGVYRSIEILTRMETLHNFGCINKKVVAKIARQAFRNILAPCMKLPNSHHILVHNSIQSPA
jgi:hypothetical protein